MVADLSLSQARALNSPALRCLSQHSPDFLQDLVQWLSFEHVAFGAALKRSLPGSIVHADTRQNDYGKIRMGRLDWFNQVQSASVGEIQVENDHVERIFFEQFDAFATGHGCGDLVTAGFEE